MKIPRGYDKYDRKAVREAYQNAKKQLTPSLNRATGVAQKENNKSIEYRITVGKK